MNLRDVATRIARRLPNAVVIEHSDPLVFIYNMGKSVVTIPEFKVQRGFVLGADGEAPTCYPPLTREELLAATAHAVENYWHRVRNEIGDVIEDSQLRTFVTVSPELDPETVTVGVYVFVAVQA